MKFIKESIRVHVKEDWIKLHKTVVAECDETQRNRITIWRSAYYPNRSVDFNRYYWVILNAISDHTGYLPAELHTHYAVKFNMESDLLPDKKGVIFSAGSTSVTNVLKFAKYVESVKLDALYFFNVDLMREEEDRKFKLPGRNKVSNDVLLRVWENGI